MSKWKDNVKIHIFLQRQWLIMNKQQCDCFMVALCKDWYWSWNSNTLATWCKELTHLKRPWCWERLMAGREGDDRGWNGWMASATQWTWVWINSGSWWWTGRPGVLRFMLSQSRTWLSNWTELNCAIDMIALIR